MEVVDSSQPHHPTRHPLPVTHPCPPTMQVHVYERTDVIARPVNAVWAWLNDPRTFTEGQVWPFRVEFVDGAVEPGVLNTHHGPLMSFTGVIGEVRPPTNAAPGYRDLQYLYGSYALSLRVIRPTRLQFWLEPTGGATQLRTRLDCWVKPSWAGRWTWMQTRFWIRFPKWASKQVGKRMRASPGAISRAQRD